MIDFIGVFYVLFLMIRKFFYCCNFLYIIYMKDIYRLNDLVISIMYYIFGNLQVSVYVVTYYIRLCEINYVWLYRYMEYFYEV